MRRISLILLGGLLLNSYVIAQDPNQTGKATQELNRDGFVAAYPGRMGQNVTVKNLETKEQIVVKIVSRIPASARIIDLSPAAWEALGLNEDSEVGLYFYNVPPEADQSSPSANTQVVETEPPFREPEIEPLPWKTESVPPPVVAVLDESPPPTVLPSQSPTRTVPPTVPFHNFVPPVPPEPKRPINVMPGIPSPYSSYTYRLQLGAFSNIDRAVQCFYRLLNAGFVPFYEPYGSMYRVVLPGIRAADIYWYIQRLDAAGFTDVWIREER